MCIRMLLQWWKYNHIAVYMDGHTWYHYQQLHTKIYVSSHGYLQRAECYFMTISM